MWNKIEHLGSILKKVWHIWAVQYHFRIPKEMWGHYLSKFNQESRKTIYNPDDEKEYSKWLSTIEYKNEGGYPFDDYVLIYEQGVQVYEECLKYIQEPHAKIVYFDQDCIKDSKRVHPLLKPVFSRDTLLGVNYIGGLALIHKSLVSDYEKNGSLYTCYLDWMEKGYDFEHQSLILFHEEPKSSRKKEVEEYSLKYNKSLCLKEKEGFIQVDYPVRNNPLVSIIIPMRDGIFDTKRCLDSLFTLTAYKNYEVILVDNGSKKKETFEYFSQIKENPNIRIMDLDIPFNYSKLNNEAISICQGELILLLNNDTEIIQADWMDKMIGYAQQPWVGSVGCTLLYPDRTYQHTGILAGKGGIAAHRYYQSFEKEKGYDYHLKVVEDMAGCTAACLMLRKEVFQEVGGLNNQLAVNYNDVDLAFKLLEAGYQNVFLPQVSLIHHESKSRGIDKDSKTIARYQKEMEYMKVRWNQYLSEDPYYSNGWDKSKDYQLIVSHSEYTMLK